MRFSAKHADFAAQLTFFMVLLGFALIAYTAGGVDFRGYYGAALVVTRGGNPYDYSQLAPVLEEVTGFAGNNPYFYPPWFSLLFVPFTLLPFQIARLAWSLLNAALLYGSLRQIKEVLAWKISGWKKWGVYLTATLAFGAYCMRSEQASILLLFFLSHALISMKQKRYAQAGLALILLASKPQVTGLAVIVAALWLLQRQRPSLAWAALWTIVLTVLSSIAIPTWWQFDRSEFGAGLAYELDGPGKIAAERVLSTLYDFSEFVLHLNPPAQLTLVIAVTAFGLVLLIKAWQHFDALVRPLSAALLLTLLVTPYALQYDYALLILPFMWTFMHLKAVDTTWRWIVVGLLVMNVAVLFWQQWSYQGYLQLLAVTGAFAITLFTVKGSTHDSPAISGASLVKADQA